MHPGHSLIELNQFSSQRLSSPSVSMPLHPQHSTEHCGGWMMHADETKH